MRFVFCGTNVPKPYAIVSARRTAYAGRCQGSVRPQEAWKTSRQIVPRCNHEPDEIVKLTVAPRCGHLTMEKALFTVWET